jgi:hypothetical protein
VCLCTTLHCVRPVLAPLTAPSLPCRCELVQIMDANTKHTLVVAIDPAMVSFLVGNQAAKVRAVQTACRVSMHVRRASPTADAEAGASAAPEASAGDSAAPVAGAGAGGKGPRGGKGAVAAAAAASATSAAAAAPAGAGKGKGAASGTGAAPAAAAGAGAGKGKGKAAPAAAVAAPVAAPVAHAEEAGPPGALAWVVIVGVKSALELAQAELRKLQEEFSRQYIALTVPTAIARAVIGKGGDNVKKLRTTTGANIDVDLGAAEAGR